MTACVRDYALDMYKLSTKITRREATIEGRTGGQMLSQLLCPVLLALDEQRQAVDVCIGGEESRQTFALVEKVR